MVVIALQASAARAATGYVVGEPVSATTVNRSVFTGDTAIGIADAPAETATKMRYVQVTTAFRPSFRLRATRASWVSGSTSPAPCRLFLPPRPGVHADSLMPQIAVRTVRFIGAVIENLAPPRRAAAMAVAPVVGGVGAHGDQPAPAAGCGGGQCVGHEPGRAAGGVGATPTQPGRGDDRRGQGAETKAIKVFSPLTPVECVYVRYRRAAVPS